MSARSRAAATFLPRAKRRAGGRTQPPLKTPALDAPIGALSGGNQQKVVIARNVMTAPRVLMMDEPTRGVDVAAKGEIVETNAAPGRRGNGRGVRDLGPGRNSGRGDPRGRDVARPDHRGSV